MTTRHPYAPHSAPTSHDLPKHGSRHVLRKLDALKRESAHIARLATRHLTAYLRHGWIENVKADAIYGRKSAVLLAFYVAIFACGLVHILSSDESGAGDEALSMTGVSTARAYTVAPYTPTPVDLAPDVITPHVDEPTLDAPTADALANPPFPVASGGGSGVFSWTWTESHAPIDPPPEFGAHPLSAEVDERDRRLRDLEYRVQDLERRINQMRAM